MLSQKTVIKKHPIVQSIIGIVVVFVVRCRRQHAFTSLHLSCAVKNAPARIKAIVKKTTACTDNKPQKINVKSNHATINWR